MFKFSLNSSFCIKLKGLSLFQYFCSEDFNILIFEVGDPNRKSFQLGAKFFPSLNDSPGLGSQISCFMFEISLFIVGLLINGETKEL